MKASQIDASLKPKCCNYANRFQYIPDELLFYSLPFRYFRLIRSYKLEPASGLEPLTSPLPRGCSTTWATWACLIFRPRIYKIRNKAIFFWKIAMFFILLLWSWQLDLNQRPADYKSAALPTELCQLENAKWSGKRGSNPQPTAWKAVALANWAIPAIPNLFYMVARVGFEPVKAEPTDLQSVPFGRSGISPQS